jgi:hypothetical protein
MLEGMGIQWFSDDARRGHESIMSELRRCKDAGMQYVRGIEERATRKRRRDEALIVLSVFIAIFVLL